MPLFMENRFGILIILLVFIFGTYGIQGIVALGQREIVVSEYTIDQGDERLEDYDTGLNVSTYGSEIVRTDVFSIISGVWSFLTFQFIEGTPLAISLVFSFVMLIALVTTIFIVSSVIYDFVKALPLT